MAKLVGDEARLLIGFGAGTMGERLLTTFAQIAAETEIDVIGGICFCNNNKADAKKTTERGLKRIVGKNHVHVLNMSMVNAANGYGGDHAAALADRGSWRPSLDQMIRKCLEEARRHSYMLSGVLVVSPWTGGHAPITQEMCQKLGEFGAANFMTLSSIPGTFDRRNGLAKNPDYVLDQAISAGSKWVTYIDWNSPLVAKHGHEEEAAKYADLLWAHWAAALGVGHWLNEDDTMEFRNLVTQMTRGVEFGQAVLINLGFGVRAIIPVPETRHSIFTRPFVWFWRGLTNYKRRVKYGHILLMAQHAMVDAFFDKDWRLFEGDPDPEAIERHNQYVTVQMNLDPRDRGSAQFLARLKKDLQDFIRDPVSNTADQDVADRVKQIIKANGGVLPFDTSKVDLLVIPGKRGAPRPVDTDPDLAPDTIQVTFAFQVEGTRPKAIQEICNLVKDPESKPAESEVNSSTT